MTSLFVIWKAFIQQDKDKSMVAAKHNPKCDTLNVGKTRREKSPNKLPSELISKPLYMIK